MQTAQAVAASVPPPAVITQDPTGDQLIEAGFVPNAFILDLNHGLTVPQGFALHGIWALPSRMMRHPIEVGDLIDGERAIGIRHPLLADHPFVKAVQDHLGVILQPGGAPNRHGVSNSRNFLWYHAVDLFLAGRWQDALDTREFTTTRDLAGAVEFSLTCGGTGETRLSTAEARRILNELGIPEPDDAAALIHDFHRPSPVQDENAERWPVNTGRMDPGDRAWAIIVGLDTGWFGRDRSGHIHWSRLGRDRYAAGPAATFVEQTTGQGAFAF